MNDARKNEQQWLAMWLVYATAALIAAAVNRIRVRFAEQDQRRLAFEDDLRCDVPTH